MEKPNSPGTIDFATLLRNADALSAQPTTTQVHPKPRPTQVPNRILPAAALAIGMATEGGAMFADHSPPPNPPAHEAFSPPPTNPLNLEGVVKLTAIPDPTPGRSETEPLPPHIPTISSSPTSAPTQSPPTPTETPFVIEGGVKVTNEIMKPFVLEAFKKRQERAVNDPEYAHRIDPELNATRINFVLFIQGENYEPPSTREVMGDYQIVSYDIKSNTVDMVTITHDMLAPEIERSLKPDDPRTKDQRMKRIDKAYAVGKFDLMRKTIEDATGFSVDFQVAGNDALLKDFIDNVLGGVSVDVPYDMPVEKIYVNGAEYPAYRFQKGEQKMDGVNSLRYIKGMDASGSSDTGADKVRERHVRQHLVLDSLLQTAKNNKEDAEFLSKASSWLENLSSDKSIAFDFDLKKLVGHQFLLGVAEKTGRIPVLSSLESGVVGLVSRLGLGSDAIPQINRKVFVVDTNSGDGGSRWIASDPKKEQLHQLGYTDDSLEIASDGDPKSADLVRGYWPSTRKLVKDTLLGKH